MTQHSFRPDHPSTNRKLIFREKRDINVSEARSAPRDETGQAYFTAGQGLCHAGRLLQLP